MIKFIERTEKSMQETEARVRRWFYFSLVSSVVYIPCVVWVILFGENIKIGDQIFLSCLLLLIVVCVLGISFSYYNIKKCRKDYKQQMKKIDEDYQEFLKKSIDDRIAYMKQFDS